MLSGISRVNCRFTLFDLLPGILEREQEQSVVYGSIDFGKTVVTSEKYRELVRFSWNLFGILCCFQHYFRCIAGARSPFLEFLLPVHGTIFFLSYWLLSQITHYQNAEDQ